MKFKTILLAFLSIFLVACRAEPSNVGLSSSESKAYAEVSAAVSQPEQHSSSSIESSSEEAMGLNLPVANVSAKYAKDAQKILNSFYNANDLLPKSIPTVWTDTLDKQKRYHLLTQWCYPAYAIDYYFLTPKQAADQMRNGETLPEVVAKNQEYYEEFYGDGQTIGVLYYETDPQIVVGEAGYHKAYDPNRILFWNTWNPKPDTALFLEDDLLAALEEQGFNLSATSAMSISIPGHSAGVYFTDGVVERYLPQGMFDNPPFLNYNELCTIPTLIESFEIYTPFDYSGSSKTSCDESVSSSK